MFHCLKRNPTGRIHDTWEGYEARGPWKIITLQHFGIPALSFPGQNEHVSAKLLKIPVLCKHICRFPLHWFHQVATADAKMSTIWCIPRVDPRHLWFSLATTPPITQRYVSPLSNQNSAAGDPKLMDRHVALLVTRARELLLNFHSFGYGSVHPVLVVNIWRPKLLNITMMLNHCWWLVWWLWVYLWNCPFHPPGQHQCRYEPLLQSLPWLTNFKHYKAVIIN